MKSFIYRILLIIFILSVSCEHKAKKVVIKPKVEKLVWHIHGLPDMFILKHSFVIYNRWGINCFLEGCISSVKGREQNKITAKILEKRHGIFWQEVFRQSVNEEFANRFVVYDLINNYNEIVRIKKEYGKKLKDMNMRILCLAKYKYAVLVTWDLKTDVEEHIPGQILLVNVATKMVTKSDDKVKYDWREGV
jgi:hypothetical protein